MQYISILKSCASYTYNFKKQTLYENRIYRIKKIKKIELGRK